MFKEAFDLLALLSSVVTRPHRTTTEFTNNQSYRMFNMPRTRKLGVTAGRVEKGLVPR